MVISSIMRTARRRLANWRTVARFRRAYRRYLANPVRCTDMDSQGILRAAFVASRGKVLRWAHDLQRVRSPHQSSAATSSLFPLLDEKAVDRAVADLRSDGYHVLPWRMSDAWIHAVLSAAGELNVTSRSNRTDVQRARDIQPRSATYWHGSDIGRIPAIQEFVGDRGILEIIGRYLECQPVFDMTAAWWSFPMSKADSASAQLYHFDLDRIRWLKVFVYLTDVGPANGPHAFIRGSHRTIGEKICRDGRYTDEEVFRLYPKKDEVVFTAPAGTVLIEDTLGFHKGMPVQEGKRFIFEYEYSVNGFGYPY